MGKADITRPWYYFCQQFPHPCLYSNSILCKTTSLPSSILVPLCIGCQLPTNASDSYLCLVQSHNNVWKAGFVGVTNPCPVIGQLPPILLFHWSKLTLRSLPRHWFSGKMHFLQMRASQFQTLHNGPMPSDQRMGSCSTF